MISKRKLIVIAISHSCSIKDQVLVKKRVYRDFYVSSGRYDNVEMNALVGILILSRLSHTADETLASTVL